MSSAISSNRRVYRLGYQPALDGLRGLAVFGVLAYHGGIDRARGGFLGVDVFFVLSGFLITSLLLQEWAQSERIDLREFWARRVRRLMPALVAFLVAMVGWLVVFADPGQRSSMRLDILGALGYVANWRFLSSGQSYFEQFQQPSPLRHTWSLAVEEQFYLIWPVLVWGGLRLTRGRLGRLALLVIGGAVVSAVWAVLLYRGGDVSRIYYGTDTRAQELLVGAGAAILIAKATIGARLHRALDVLGLASLAALATAMVRVSDSSPALYRGGFLAVSTLVVIVIAGALHPGRGVVKSIMSWLPFRALGKISYGLYLWHWPVNIALTSDATGFDGWALWAIRLQASLILALLSYFCIERPVLQMHHAIRPFLSGMPTHWAFGLTRAAGASLAMAVIAAIVAVAQGSSAPSNTPGGIPSQAAVGTTLSTVLASSPSASSIESANIKDAKPEGVGSPSTENPEPLKVQITGDSIAFTLGFGFSPQSVDPGLAIKVTAILGCGVVPGQPYIDGRPHPEDFSHCNTWEDTWRRGMDDNKPDAVVVLLGAWEVMDRKVDGKVLEMGTPAHTAYLVQQLTKGFDIVTANGTPVIFLTAPCYRETEARLGGTKSDRNDPQRVALFNKIAEQVLESYGSQITTLDLGSYICPGGQPLQKLNGVQLRYDGVHFTKEGGAEVWKWLAPQVRSIVKKPLHQS